ncbi:MAG TPA: nucleotidyltransferase domain-containing protein [Saprospiraceae bacterium]|nr:nucleotidyltransferase domain-containing protein [Saprospiraceae bacterium]HMP22895.1 nucleotidyltransferase domain-containing protein [Saprospiraceae bacterium]
MAIIMDLVKAEIEQIDKGAEVILFGSRARGNYDADSDWDFLILLSYPVDFDVEELIRNKLYEIELETGEIITSIIEEKSIWEKYERTLIYKNIKEEGIVVV